MVRETERIEMTIDEYLKSCHCSTISFSAGGNVLFMTLDESAIIYPSVHKVRIKNDLILIRHFDKETDELIEIQVERKINETKIREKLFYMMYPSGFFMHE